MKNSWPVHAYSAARLEMGYFLSLALLLTTVFCLHPANASPLADVTSELKQTISILSEEGDRSTGSRGNELAAEYIQQRLQAAQPEKMGQVDFEVAVRKHSGSELITRQGTYRLHPLLYNAITPQNLSSEGLSGNLIYVGKGELQDFNGLDVAGSIVIMEFDSGRNWLNAASLGAAGLIYIGGDNAPRARFLDKIELSPIQFPCFWAQRGDMPFLPPGSALNKSQQLFSEVTIKSGMKWEKDVVSNFYAVFPGTDETLNNQLLVVEAFYDASSFISGSAPGADEALSIASLLNLADHLQKNPPRRPFLLMATNGHHQALAGMREMIWITASPSKDLRQMGKQLRADRKQRTSYLKALNTFLKQNKDDLDAAVLKAGLEQTLKLEIDSLSTQLIDLRMNEAGNVDDTIQKLADERLVLRKISWRNDFDNLSEIERRLLLPLAEKSALLHTRVLEEVNQQHEMLKKSRKMRSMLAEYEPRAIVSLHLSSHGTGLGAFERGFKYPLRDRINRTGAFRTIHEVLTQSAAGIPEPSPVFVSTLRPNRLQPWQDLLPDKPHLGGEISCLAGLPGLTLTTTGDLRSSWGTPFDTPENINWDKAARQHLLVLHLLHGLDNAENLPLGYIRDGFSTVSGNASLLLHGELFANQPAPQTVLLAFQGPSRYHLLTDYQGKFIIKGVADKKHVRDKVIIEGYRFSKTNDSVEWAIDKNLTGKPAYRVKMNRQQMRTDLVMFNCRQTTIFNLLEPRSLNYMTKLQLIDGRREAPPLRYWYSRIDTRSSIIASIYLEPGTRLKLTLSDSILKKKMILTNSSEENPQGLGYEIDTNPSLYNTSYLTARDIWTLLEPRIGNLEKHGIHNDRIKELQLQGTKALAAARTALQDKQYDNFSEAANTSWALASRVYDHVEGTQKDVLFGVLFYIALFVPFAFCMERLLFGYVSIYKRIIAFSIILVVLIGVISYVHPAFALAYSPTVVILAFFIIGLSFLVTMIIVLRFETEMVHLQRRSSHKQATEISTWKAFIASFYLGVSNLRRRKLRTGLTCLTLVILTFTIMSFTSVSSNRRENKLSFEDSSPYQGILLKDIGWNTLPRETLSTFKSLFEGKFTTGPRVWLSSDDPARAGRLQVNFGEFPFLIQGVMGLAPEEPEISNLDQILIKGRWFDEDEANGVLIPSRLAAQIDIDPDKPDQPMLNLWGVPLKVTGIFSEKLLQNFNDLDGEMLTPAIFPSSGVQEITEVEQEALESGEDVQLFQGRYRHLDTDQILILPAQTLLSMGGELKSVALASSSPITDNMLSTLTDRFNLTLFSGEKDGVYVYNASDTMSYSGMPNILIPLIISILIVLNTMISSVYERKREIAVYTSVGLAPTHVSFLFIAEAMAFAVLSVVLGYLLAQTSASLFASTPLWQGITVNYSSTAGVAAMFLVMAVVLLSVIYPSRVAANIAIPDVNKSWQMPEVNNDSLTVTLPFLMRYHEHASIAGFLYAYFIAHQDVSHGIFSTGPVVTIPTSSIDPQTDNRLPLVDDCLHLRTKVWLAPFDFGIMQWVDISFCHAKEGEDFLEISVTMNRRSGESGVWKRVNSSFVHTLRKQLLVWRSLDAEGHEEYAQLLAQSPGHQQNSEVLP